MSEKKHPILELLDFLESDEFAERKALIRENVDTLVQTAVLDAFTVASSSLQLATLLASTVIEETPKASWDSGERLVGILKDALKPGETSAPKEVMGDDDSSDESSGDSSDDSHGDPDPHSAEEKNDDELEKVEGENSDEN